MASLETPCNKPSAAIRDGTSLAELAWIVPQPPSWPVLSASRKSIISRPRTSPMTILVGRIRSA